MNAASTVPLHTAAQAREFDRIAIAQEGVSGGELMARAGAALFGALVSHWPGARRVLVLCGAGNNAGDGYVTARLLEEGGIGVQVLWLADPDGLRGDARAAADACRRAGVDMAPYGDSLPQDADVLVDALLGTGLTRPLEGRWRQVVEAMNRHRAPVLAADLPSGLAADTGCVLGVAVEADVTVTFIARKRGLYTAAGRHCSGTVLFDDLGVPPRVLESLPPAAELLLRPPLGPLGRPRRRDAHKGDCGHVLVVGGNAGLAGAARMAAEAAARAGAGLVSVATRPAHVAAMSAARPELMCHGVDDARGLAPLLARADVVAVGPGLGRDRWAQALLGRVLDAGLPLVVDADALNLLAREPERRHDWILTPHPGEAGRLLGRSTAGVQADRFAAAEELARRYGGVAVLKGAGTLVAVDGPPVRVCGAGNPGMASGGMGDVLTGLIAALLAQGLGGFDAASAGVCLHAAAADDAAAADGERGLLATDVLGGIRRRLNATD